MRNRSSATTRSRNSATTQQPQQRYTQPMPRYQARQPTCSNYGNVGLRQRDFVVARRDVNPWYWNGGRTWVASPAYWGGGFWGAFAINLGFNQASASYYQVAPSSPGSQLLANYGLTANGLQPAEPRRHHRTGRQPNLRLSERRSWTGSVQRRSVDLEPDLGLNGKATAETRTEARFFFMSAA